MKKILLTLLILLILCPTIFIIFVFFNYLTDDLDFCLDTGSCKENLQINTEYGLITINEETCIKYHWKWDVKRRYCNVNKTDEPKASDR